MKVKDSKFFAAMPAVREKGFGALKTNIFIYNGGAPRLAARVWRSVHA
jgi:hypothetical protein